MIYHNIYFPTWQYYWAGLIRADETVQRLLLECRCYCLCKDKQIIIWYAYTGKRFGDGWPWPLTPRSWKPSHKNITAGKLVIKQLSINFTETDPQSKKL